MSLKSFFHDLFEKIGHIFQGLLPKLKTAIHWGVVITDAIKTFDANTPMVADFLTAVIPGDLDDKIKARIREKLPTIVTELRMVEATAGLTDPNEILVAASKFIQQLDEDYKGPFLHSLSIKIAQVAADGELNWNDAVYLLQWYYEHEYQNKAVVDEQSAEAPSI